MGTKSLWSVPGRHSVCCDGQYQMDVLLSDLISTFLQLIWKNCILETDYAL